MRSLNSLPTDGKAKLRDVNDMTAKLLFVLFLLLPISISCKEKSCEDLSAKNRSAIVRKIRDFIQLHKSSDAVSAWNEDEIVNHRFERISKKDTELFVFKKDSDGNNYVLCTYGKKGAYASAPVEYWLIDESGFLCMHENLISKKRSSIKIKKIKIDTDNGIVYTFRNHKKVLYTYTEGLN